MRLRSVDQDDPLLRTEDHGLETLRAENLGGRSRLGAAPQRSFADQRQREMCKRRQIAACTDAPLLRNRRMYAGIQHRDQQLGERRTGARKTGGDHIGAEQHHRAHFSLRQQRAHARGVAADEIDLKLGETIDGDDDVGQLAESRGDSVCNRLALDQRVDVLASLGFGKRREQKWQLDISLSGQHREQIIELKDKANVPGPPGGQLTVGHLVNAVSADLN